MEKDEKQHNADNADQIAKSMLANEKEKERERTNRMNRLWIWLGVMFLVAILIWFMYFLGFLEFLS